MAMVAQLSNGSLAVAYQAAEFAEEGGSEQHIQLVIGDFEEDDEHLSPKPTQQPANGTNYNIIFQVWHAHTTTDCASSFASKHACSREASVPPIGPPVVEI